MGYSNVTTVDFILAQALTSAKPNQGDQKIKLINIGEIRDLNRISDDTVRYYIRIADDHIDAILNQQYQTPFPKCAHGQWYVEEDINVPQVAESSAADSAGNTLTSSTLFTPTNIIVIEETSSLLIGDEIRLINDLTGQEEKHFIAEIVDDNTFKTVDNIEGTYLADDGVRVIRVMHAPPLAQISARYAAANIYDKYFAAQSSPDVSNYGNAMRAEADSQLNNILNGKIFIKCARRKGDLFGNPNLDSAYAVRFPYDDGGKAAKSDRDMSGGRT